RHKARPGECRADAAEQQRVHVCELTAGGRSVPSDNRDGPEGPSYNLIRRRQSSKSVMPDPNTSLHHRRTRREFLWNAGGGLGGLALASLVGMEGLLADVPGPKKEYNGGLHHKARAKRVIQLFMNGGVSQMDTFDYK